MIEWSKAMDRVHELFAYSRAGFNSFEIAEMFNLSADVVSAILVNPGSELVH